MQKLTLHQFNYIQIKEYNCTEDASPSERVKLVWNLYRSRMKSANYCQTELTALIKKSKKERKSFFSSHTIHRIESHIQAFLNIARKMILRERHEDS